MKNRVARWVVFVCLLLGVGALALYALKGSFIPRPIPKVEKYEPWNEELVEVVSGMPIQEGGRLKPFSTWAMFRLYSIHSKRKIK